jgi:hypothetical protein
MVGKKTPYNIPTCSTLPDIKGISGYTTRNERLDIAIKASKGIQPEYKEQTITQMMGDVLEPVLCKFAGELLGLDSVKTDHEEPVTHPLIPLMGSLDATGIANKLFFKKNQYDWLKIPEQESIVLDGPGVIECKCTRNSEPENIEEWRGVLQAKGLMECTSYSWAAVIVLWQSTNFKIYLYTRKQEFKEELSALCLDFSNRVKNEMYYPPTTTSDANIAHSHVVKKRISLEHDADNLCKIILDNKESIKHLKSIIEDSEIKLKEMIKDNEEAVTNKYIIKWPMINYKPQPEKIIPAKEGKTIRSTTLRIKEYE